MNNINVTVLACGKRFEQGELRPELVPALLAALATRQREFGGDFEIETQSGDGSFCLYDAQGGDSRLRRVGLEEANGVYYDIDGRTIYTKCTKCDSPIQLRLGPIQDAETVRKAIGMVVERPGMCPPLATGGFAAWAHPELGFYGFWQVSAVFTLIDHLVEQGHLLAQLAEA